MNDEADRSRDRSRDGLPDGLPDGLSDGLPDGCGDGRGDGSVRVDGPRVRALRRTAGLTQQRLAAMAGYTDRAVRKLERGGPVRRETLEDVATALTDAGVALPAGGADALTLDRSPGERERLLRAWFDRAFNGRDPAAVETFVAPDVLLYAEGVVRSGRDVIRGRVAALLAGFDPLRLTVDRVLCDGDEALAHWTVVKTHSGPFLDLAPTGRAVTVRGSSWCRYQGDLIVEVRDHWDVEDLLRQLRGEPPRAV